MFTFPLDVDVDEPMDSVTRPLISRGDATLRWRAAQGDFIRQARESRGLTQEELADLATGCCKQTISAIELGRAQVPPKHFRALADALRVNRVRFVTVMLRYQNPWIYADLIGGDPSLEAELSQVAGQSRRRMVGQRRPEARSG